METVFSKQQKFAYRFGSEDRKNNRQKDASWTEAIDMKKAYNDGYEDKDKELRAIGVNPDVRGQTYTCGG